MLWAGANRELPGESSVTKGVMTTPDQSAIAFPKNEPMRLLGSEMQ
jgi:hypothetical protein